MANEDRDIKFSFSWLALKLLGQGLYSNPWSALSELVANGLDAGATQVFVYIDVRDKSNASIEVFDNGSGMDRRDLTIYTTVGHNKRNDPSSVASRRSSSPPMGRKGIGKLAALYLSRQYFIRTKRDGDDSTWVLDAREDRIRDEDSPSLVSVDSLPDSPNLEAWDAFKSGTFLSLREVDLRGHGSRALSALGTRLANQFSLGGDESMRQILLFVHQPENADESPVFARANKSIAFGNMAYLNYRSSLSDSSVRASSELAAQIKMPAKGLESDTYIHEPASHEFTLEPDNTIEGWERVNDLVDFNHQTYDGHAFNLTGWIGIHGTIDTETARSNDERFEKNRFYNPAQLRLYVRGKLASDRLLDQLGITGTYINYIEGEISFDLLDHDNFRDIATSNRQDFDETDDRVTLLRALIRPIVRDLIARRTQLASMISAETRDIRRAAVSRSKDIFAREFSADLERYKGLADEVRHEIHNLATNKLVGDIAPKSQYRVFISHSSHDKPFADFIYYLLLTKGAKDEEIFYTSKSNSIEQFGDPRRLAEVVKEGITDFNTLVFYITSKNFTSSQYCLFEGGAGWATRAVGELLKLNIEYGEIPDFLTEGNVELQLLNDGTIDLSSQTHAYVIERLLNPMIEHLNNGRDISGDSPITPYVSQIVPNKLELQRLKKSVKDYYDADIVDHWDVYVAADLATYLAEYADKTR